MTVGPDQPDHAERSFPHFEQTFPELERPMGAEATVTHVATSAPTSSPAR
jgi:hypothetical protein